MRERKKRGGREPFEPKPPEGQALDHQEVLQRFRERKEKSGFKQLNVWIRAKTLLGIKEVAKKEEKTVAELVDEILEKALKRFSARG